MTAAATRLAVIYQCPECDERYLNQRRCPDCHVFTRRIGTGGTCPHCDEPDDITDLTPEEATMAPT